MSASISLARQESSGVIQHINEEGEGKGGENPTNYFQKNVVVVADQPFSPYFYALLVRGPVTGNMF